MTSPGGKSRRRGRAALWYTLASSYLVAALLLNRTLTGTWGFNSELLALAIAVPSAQLVFLEAARARPLFRNRRDGSNSEPGA